MYTLFVSLIVLASIFMIIIVLIQESKGGGLASQFSSSNVIMGVRKTTDVVEKTTWGLAAAMVVLSVVCAYVAPSAKSEQSVLEQAATETQATNPNTTPGFQGAAQQTPAAATKDATPAKDAAPAQSAAPAKADAPKAVPAETQAPAKK